MPSASFKTTIVLGLSLGLLNACGSNKEKERVPKVPDFPQFYGEDYFNLDSIAGGINVDRAYAEGTFSHEVIVAVIDSGISLDHEDLRDHLWTNTKEIPNNNIDDDSNGYVDDIHGWNYLVDKEGNTIRSETLEVTRELQRLKALQAQRPLNEKEAAYLNEVEDAYNQGKETGRGSLYYDLASQQRADDLDDFTPIDATHPAYGNNQIEDLDDHGSHVAGIIAAVRNNGIGIRGIADNARIMALRAVPDGDEQDKDIYHAVRYAVDHGARVINMSFGKSFSRNPEKVKEAFQYAHEHNVLLVHAAGNAGLDIDRATNFPSRGVNGDLPLNDSWLDVGAVARGPGFIQASFSNYGKTTVDLFAPGVSILSTTRYNSYVAYSGTSMAAPVVSGTAALILGAYPNLKSTDLRKLILETARTSDNNGVTLGLADQSISGGVIDALALLRKVKEQSSTKPAI